jgi:predicted RNA-binding Zn-ribbon protein involved in translation (DUF1610 family)
MSKYARPYCKNCKLVYGMRAIGLVTHCTQCGQPLTLKSVNPWPKTFGGIALISVGLVTIFFWMIPIVWIGAFIWGGSLIYKGWKQWSQVKKLDVASESPHIKGEYEVPKPQSRKTNMKDDDKHVVITCGACSYRFRVRRGQGTIKIRCPNCGRESNIIT